MNVDDLNAILEDEVAAEIETIGAETTCSAAQAAVARDGELLYERALGRTRLDSAGNPVDVDTPFDVASLTKPVVTGTLLMQAVDEGRVDWGAPLAETSGNWSNDPEADGITWRQLANHTSGLPDWAPLYKHLSLRPSPDAVDPNQTTILRRIRETPLDSPPGEREEYSDLGYIMLGCALEQTLGDSLDALARDRIIEPLGLGHTAFISARRGDTPIDSAPATEDDPLRNGPVVGEVHDRNAAAFGGVAGHAGLFSTARDLAAFGAHLLSIDRGASPENPLVDRNVLQDCWSPAAIGPDGHHAVGWDTPSGDPSSSGRGFESGRTVGHLGFTGASIWLERDRNLVAVLLTNRVYPSRENDRIRQLRIRFHEAILPPDTESSPAPQSP